MWAFFILKSQTGIQDHWLLAALSFRAASVQGEMWTYSHHRCFSSDFGVIQHKQNLLIAHSIQECYELIYYRWFLHHTKNECVNASNWFICCRRHSVAAAIANRINNDCTMHILLLMHYHRFGASIQKEMHSRQPMFRSILNHYLVLLEFESLCGEWSCHLWWRNVHVLQIRLAWEITATSHYSVFAPKQSQVFDVWHLMHGKP